ncbi:hypothetical protein COTS27_01620 [Spirochaetota bacterium]|nr:hypothetical protein COTS27_01620 [Spirochaetota bacterium]
MKRLLGRRKNRSGVSFKELLGGEVKILEGRTYGTFKGVYLPTILNIMGLMMYLRQGWVVGNAGLLGAMSIVLFSCLITGITALCISSIVTNIRIGSGGVFSLVSQSLGLQVGGSIGIPLYLVQGLSAVLYMYGFLEAWAFIFPEHPRYLVTTILAGVMFVIAFIGVNFVFRAQILIMIVVFFALASIFGGAWTAERTIGTEVVLWGDFTDASYWELFAIYFPAVTGIKVGASMSGSLERPRYSIPVGTLLAWATATMIYLALCVWYAVMGSTDELRSNFLFSVENAWIEELVLLGIMSSCFTAALSSIVAAPRVLQALSVYNILPFSRYLQKLRNGEPRNAFLITMTLVVIVILSFNSINAIAPVITQFFIVIYFIINAVLVLEQRLNLVSFRPALRLPMWVPILGSVLSLVAMVIISPVLGLVSLFSVVMLYLYLSRKQLQAPWETVQSGLLVALSEWLMRWAVKTGSRVNRRIWKPDFLVLLSDEVEFKHWYRLLRSMLYSQGSLNIVVLTRRGRAGKLLREGPSQSKLLKISREQVLNNLRGIQLLPPMVKRLLKSFHSYGIYASAATMESRMYMTGFSSVVGLAESFFPVPNSVFVSVRKHNEADLNKMLRITRNSYKAIVFFVSPLMMAITGREKEVVIWVRDQTPDWQLSFSMSNLDYAILLGYQIKKNWNGHLRLVCAVADEARVDYATDYLEQLSEFARLGDRVSVHVLPQQFEVAIKQFTSADLHIIGLGDRLDKRSLLRLSHLAKSSCLFVKDSGAGLESALV